MLSGTILREKSKSVNFATKEKIHFLFDCSKYEDARKTSFRKNNEIDKVNLNMSIRLII